MLHPDIFHEWIYLNDRNKQYKNKKKECTIHEIYRSIQNHSDALLLSFELFKEIITPKWDERITADVVHPKKHQIRWNRDDHLNHWKKTFVRGLKKHNMDLSVKNLVLSNIENGSSLQETSRNMNMNFYGLEFARLIGDIQMTKGVNYWPNQYKRMLKKYTFVYDRHNAIQERAYYLSLEFPDNSEQDNWLLAEEIENKK